MSASTPGPAFGATFDDAALAEDLEHASEHGKPVLHCLAFGRRHPLRAAQPSVYEMAARRLDR